MAIDWSVAHYSAVYRNVVRAGRIQAPQHPGHNIAIPAWRKQRGKSRRPDTHSRPTLSETHSKKLEQAAQVYGRRARTHLLSEATASCCAGLSAPHSCISSCNPISGTSGCRASTIGIKVANVETTAKPLRPRTDTYPVRNPIYGVDWRRARGMTEALPMPSLA